MSESGVCADGEALYAVFQNGTGVVKKPLKAKSVADADDEVRRLTEAGSGIFQYLEACTEKPS